jgi:RNA polymerase sigma factor (sigma-70 family)
VAVSLQSPRDNQVGEPVIPPRSALPDDSPALRHDRDVAACEDGALLARYCASRDQNAFAQIAARYGPMVFRTCYRRLANVHDAEDASQAVFLLLARQPHKAQLSLAGWLHKAARDTAITLLRARARRARREEAAAMRPATPNANADTLREEIDNGIARLPTQLREAVIVCYLEGHRQEEAARRLGCSQGTLSRRAADAVERLRALLVRRGVAVSSAALLGYLLQQQAAAAVPEGLVGSLALAASGKAALSASAGALADATARAGLLAKAKIAAGVVVAATVVAAAAVLALRQESAPARPTLVLANFDGPTLPLNKAGAGFPAADDDDTRFTTSIEPLDAVAGKSLRLRLTAGRLKVPFMPEDAKGRKLFAREQAADPAAWRFNTYNRFRFWLKLPVEAAPHSTTGSTNMNVGTYVKRVKDADERSLDAGGGAFCHRINVPALACWTQVVLNMHPHALRDSGERDANFLPHPTGEPAYNYFDALTRFYIEARQPPARYPADCLFDEMEFYQETQPENEEQVYSIAAAHILAQNRVLVTWNRRVAEDSVDHEVRYAFSDIHTTGWKNAKPAPKGFVTPPGQGIANGMVYDSQDLPLAGERLVYIAIKPQNAELFSQIAVPLTLK